MAKILIIEDERLARITLRKILENAGYDVAEAGTGTEGIAMYRSTQCDLVITDIIMPDKEGIETIIELRRDFPGVRVIAISGGGRTRNLDFLKLAQQYGAEKILAKPFSQEDLLKVVKDVLGSPVPSNA